MTKSEPKNAMITASRGTVDPTPAPLRPLGITPWIVDGYLKENEVTVLTGAPQSGLSNLAALFTLLIASGAPFGDHFVRQENVLWIDTDDHNSETRTGTTRAGKTDTATSIIQRQLRYRKIDPEVLTERIHIANWTNRPDTTLFMAGDPTKPSVALHEISKLALIHNSSVVVIDNIERLLPPDANPRLESDTASSVALLKRFFGRFGRAVLLVCPNETHAPVFPQLNGIIVTRNAQDSVSKLKSRKTNASTTVAWGAATASPPYPMHIDRTHNAFARRNQTAFEPADQVAFETETN